MIIKFKGSLNDASVWSTCDLKALLEFGYLEQLGKGIIENSVKIIPYFFPADPAFPLQKYLITPYSRCKNLTESQRVFNYRHSRSRRIIGND